MKNWSIEIVFDEKTEEKVITPVLESLGEFLASYFDALNITAVVMIKNEEADEQDAE